MSSIPKCPRGDCIPKITRVGLCFCEKCEYQCTKPKCYRFGCKKDAVTIIFDKLAITPRKAVCEEHRAGAKFRR